jgi:fructokinase
MKAGSIPFFLEVPLIEPFRKILKFQGPLVFDNDANCFALAEAYYGAGAEWASQNGIPMGELCMIGITLGTGVGGGIIVRGELVRGRRGGAGEVGHMTLVPKGRDCYCGRFGCAEQYLSGEAFKKDSIEDYRASLVMFLSNLSNCFDPHVIVLGGGVSQQAGIYENMSERLSKECFLTANPPAVLAHKGGDSAGVIGAALLSYVESKRA